NLTQADIYDQFVFSSAKTPGTGINIQINRLAPNTPYELILWSFDEANEELEDWSEISSGTPTIIQNGYAFNGEVLPTANYEDTITNVVVSSSQGELEIQGVVDPASTGKSGVFLNAITLSANPQIAPQITQQPASDSTTQNSAYTNNVTAWGTPPLAYQWYQTNVAVQGQTNANLVLDSVQTNNAGDYYVVVTNDYGSVTSTVVTLTVYSTPVILQSYTNLTLYAGANPTLSVLAAGVAPLSYQWTSNGVVIAGATNASTIQSGLPAGSANYACIVTNSLGSVTDAISLTIISAPTSPYPQAVLAANPIGYWRLNETNNPSNPGNNGVIANDYWGGHDGIYTNVLLGNLGYNPITDTSDTSAYFGDDPDGGSDFGDQDVNSIAGVNFGTPAGSNVAFTVEAWANGYEQTSDAGIVALGWGSGGEQFDLDTGASDPAHDFRFLIRSASGTVYDVVSSIAPVFGNWYHLVGVVDEISNKDVTFYINGKSVGETSVPSGSGILSSTYPMSIGSRMGSLNTNYNFQFVGEINDVAVYNYALSVDQVANEYDAGGGTIAPYFQLPETSASATATATLTILESAVGTPPMSYWWTNVTTDAAIASGTANANTSGNVSLSYPNVPLSWNGDRLEETVANAYGSTNVVVTLSIANINPNPTNIVFSLTTTNLMLSWPADHTGWQLQAQTNSLSVGIGTNWANVSGSTSTNKVVMPITLTNGCVFYRLTY
ncbi:MAG: LamG-like jellyroll fold domain-containing protein, partial [Limisphaerales bacterium]